MIHAKNSREEAIARAWAALTAIIMLRGDAIEADDFDALADIEPHLKAAIQRGLKALAIPRKPIKPNQTHRLHDYVQELTVIETLVLLADEHGAEVPASLADMRGPLRDVIRQFVKS